MLVNLIFAPHKPYREKKTPFECGYHSFLLQNRTQFTISFFIFGLLFLLFDLEIILITPYSVSSYFNAGYGTFWVIAFVFILALGFLFELGKKALVIDTKQGDNLSGNFKKPTLESSHLESRLFPSLTNIRERLDKIWYFVLVRYYRFTGNKYIKPLKDNLPILTQCMALFFAVIRILLSVNWEPVELAVHNLHIDWDKVVPFLKGEVKVDPNDMSNIWLWQDDIATMGPVASEAAISIPPKVEDCHILMAQQGSSQGNSANNPGNVAPGNTGSNQGNQSPENTASSIQVPEHWINLDRLKNRWDNIIREHPNYSKYQHMTTLLDREAEEKKASLERMGLPSDSIKLTQLGVTERGNHEIQVILRRILVDFSHTPHGTPWREQIDPANRPANYSRINADYGFRTLIWNAYDWDNAWNPR